MLLAACFGSVGKMQTMDTICNHGGNYVDVLLRQFGVGVQKPGKTVHYKNQDGTDGSILSPLIFSRMASRKCCVKRFIADTGTTPR